MTCACGKGTVWFDHTARKWRGCECAALRDINAQGRKT